MGNNHSYSSDVVYCGMFARYSLRRNPHYSNLVGDSSDKSNYSLADWQHMDNDTANHINSTENQIYEEDANSFAKVSVNHNELDSQVQVTIIPYFGCLAGREVEFNVLENNAIDISVTGIESIQQFQPLLCNDRDYRTRCLEFAYDTRLQHLHMQINKKWKLNYQPSRLSFLCEQTILLNLDKISIFGLPNNIFTSIISVGDYQDLRIKTWPQNVFKSPIQLRVKKNIIVKELEWMICHKLAIFSPREMQLFSKCQRLSSEKPVSSESELHCVVKLPRDIASTNHISPIVPIIVLFEGRKTQQINTHVGITLKELDRNLRDLNNIPINSFLYMPAVMPYSMIRMYLSMGIDGTHKLLDAKSRSFPILNQYYKISLQNLYKSLPLYQNTIQELGIDEHMTLLVFEVTGPTIPIQFNQCYTFLDITNDNLNNGYQENIKALSINLSWSLHTLFNFIETISGYSGIRGVKYKQSYISIESPLVNLELNKINFIQDMINSLHSSTLAKRCLIKHVPQIIY